MALDADHPTRTLTRTRTLWGDLCLDAVACEGSSLIRPKGDAVDGGCVFQNSRTRVCIYHFRILEPFHHSMYSLVVYAGVALKTLPRAPPTAIVGKKMFLVSFRTSSCVHHVQITCWEICAKFQDYREDKKQTSPGQPMDFSTPLCSICMVCVFFTLNRSFYSSTSSAPCVRADSSSQKDTTNINSSVVTKLRHSDTIRIWTILRFTIHLVLYKPYPILTSIPYRAYILFFISSL